MPAATSPPHPRHLPPDRFPWQLGAFDAHCHPTDTMASIHSLPTMQASVLTIMATKSHDQHLVAQVAASHRLDAQQSSLSPLSLPPPPPETRVIPAFGWHPWFSHQLYHDSAPEPTYNVQNHRMHHAAVKDSPCLSPDDDTPAVPVPPAAVAAKRAHYRAVLQPPPPHDSFIDALPDPIPVSSFIAATRARLRDHPLALVGEVGLDKVCRLPQPWSDSDSDSDSDSNTDVAAPASQNATELITTPGKGRQGRLLSPHRVRMSHQQAILAAQLALAAEMDRPVSLHGVQAHGALFETVSRCWAGHELHVPSRRERRMVAPDAEHSSSSSSSTTTATSSSDEKSQDDQQASTSSEQPKTPSEPRDKKETQTHQDRHSSSSSSSSRRNHKPNPKPKPKPFPPRICLHSYSGSTTTLLDQWMHKTVPARIYVSVSAAVGLATDASRRKTDDVIRAVPPDRLLIESDLHTAGPELDASLEYMYRHACEVKGWDLEYGVSRICDNYQKFIFG